MRNDAACAHRPTPITLERQSTHVPNTSSSSALGGPSTLQLFLEDDLPAAADRRDHGHDQGTDRDDHEGGRDRPGEEHRGITARDDQRPAEVLLQQGSEDVGSSVANFCREAAIARAVLWEARRGFNWTDPEVWDQIMEQLRRVEMHDAKLRADLARQRRLEPD